MKPRLKTVCGRIIFSNKIINPVFFAIAILVLINCFMSSVNIAEAADDSWISIPKTTDPLMTNLNIPANAATTGMWSPTFSLPMNGLHLVVLPTGKVLTFGTNTSGSSHDGRTLDIWDPALGFGTNSHNTTFDAARVNSFCSTASYLPNGQLMVTGGNNPKNSNLFSPADGSSRKSSLTLASDRWYSTNINLPNGGSVMLGGMVPYNEGMNNDPVGAINGGLASMTPEVFNPASGWQSLFGATSRDAFGPDYLRLSYPRAWVAPNGKVFGISSETMWYLDTTGNGLTTVAGKFKTPANNTTKPNIGPTNTAVMFAPGKILQVGGNGYSNGDGYSASAAATVVDINDVSPLLSEQPPMNFPRRYPNAIVLPDGKVAITGGTKKGNNGGADAVYPVEIWNPTTGTWSVGASAKQIRVYHSQTALLPNGTILSTGGGTPGPVTNLNGEIYYPPYLFQSLNGVSQLAPRPQIDAISSLTYENSSTLQLEMENSATISQLVLVGISSGTHSFNTSQRRIPLAFNQIGLQINAVIPNANIVPPGYYHIFALNSAGIPSKGVTIGIGAFAQPNMPMQLTSNSDVNLYPLNEDGHAIGIDANGLAISQTLSASPTAQELAATTFTVRTGNAAANCVSFEYKSKPGQFLRHKSFRLMVAASDGSATFNNDSTFCSEVGLSSLGGITLRSRNYSSNLIRNRNGQIWLDPSDNTEAFNDSASFLIKPPLATLQIPEIAAPIITSGGIVKYSPNLTIAGAQYSWSFGDGSLSTSFSNSAATSHSYSQSGMYLVTLTVRSADGSTQSKTFVQAVVNPTTAKAPASSSTIAVEASLARLWVVNPDNNSVSLFNTSNNSLVKEIAVGNSPRSVSVAPNGIIWVTNKDSSNLSLIDPSTLTVKQSISLPRASRPHGLVFAPDGSAAYVVLEATGQLLKLNPTSGNQIATLSVGANVRQLSIDANSSRILVSRFLTPSLPGESSATVDTSATGGEVLAIDASTMTLSAIVKLKHSDKTDNSTQGSGIPNYLGAPVISPDGRSAWIPSKQDNIKRGMLRNGLNLNFQNTVRAISSRIDMATMAEDYPLRIDHDNSSVASAASYDSTGAYLFVALETARQIEVVNAIEGKSLYRIDVGMAPQGVIVSKDGTRLYVQNFMERTLSVIDISLLTKNGEFKSSQVATLKSINSEKLSATVLKGKQLFYDAKDIRLAGDSYMSCATCHNDAGHDGRVWDLTGFGEGLRNTIPLKGRAGMGQGFLHWTANFDEIQDFEKQIRGLAGGLGLMSDTQFNTGTRNQPLGDKKAGVSSDLDALAAYIVSLNTFDSTPYRSIDGSLTASAIAGKSVFQNAKCTNCHAVTGFTLSGDSNQLKNIGTIKPTSGTRLGASLTGLDVPTLRDVWATAPYLHDGSASSLAAAVQSHQGNMIAGTDLTNLVTYLQQIGAEEPNLAIVMPPSNSISCANEFQTCALPTGATATVWYGAQTSWVSKTGLSGNIGCNNTTFGDPIRNVGKSCKYIVTTTTNTNTNTNTTITKSTSPPSTGINCAEEIKKQTCTIPAGKTATVWYGAKTSWFVKTGVTGSIACNNVTFGDPIYGTWKTCVYE
jgi:YVTN family beta-propeller protein